MFKCNLIHFAKVSIRNVANSPKHSSIISSTCLFNTEAVNRQQEKQSTGKIPFQSFTIEQQQKILDIVNQEDAHIFNYDIAKARATKLLAWKKRNGPLKNIEDILLIDGFGAKIAEKFYNSMLEENSEDAKDKRTTRQRIAGFATPVLDVEHRQNIHSCVSLRIGVSSVTWARLELPANQNENVPCVLTHWHHHEIAEKKLHLGDLVQRLLYVDHLLPNADVYLFENPPFAQMNSNPGSVEQQNINIQKSQIIAVLAYTLCKRNRNDEAIDSKDTKIGNDEKKLVHKRPNVFYLRRFLAARLFSQLVGSERVSTEETILQLMRTHYNLTQADDGSVDLIWKSEKQVNGEDERNASFRGNVQFSIGQREMFSHAERYHREFLGQTLLLNLAFIRLLVLQDERSIATVTRHQSKAVTEKLS